MEGLRRMGSTSRGRSLGGGGDAGALLDSLRRDFSSPPPPPGPGALDTGASSPPPTMPGLGERRASELLVKGLSGLELEQKELEQQITSIYSGIFKLFTTHASPNYACPWSKLPQESSIGTGFCIDRKRKRFITNAHCVEHAVVVQVLKRGDTKKHFAKVCAQALCAIVVE